MERFADTLAALPGTARFLAVGLPSALALAGLLFAGRRVRALSAVRALATRGLSLLLAAVLLAMVFLSALQIFLRNVFASGLLWIDPLLRHLVLLLAFLGAVAATGAKRHIQINVLGRLLHGAASRIAGAAVALLGAALCLALARASLGLLAEEIPIGETAFLGVPTWSVILVFPLAFLGMALRMALLVLEEAAGLAPAAEGEAPRDAETAT